MDDLVAELILRLNNEMNAGLDQIRAEMEGVEDGAAQIARSVAEMNTALSDVPSGMAIEAGLADVVTEASAATAAIEGMGVAIDEDTAKIKKMFEAWGSFAVPAGVGENTDPNMPFLPPGTKLPDDQPPPDVPPDEPDDDGGGRGGKKSGDDHSFGIPEMLAFLDGQAAVENNAKFSSTLAQITNTEKLHGDEASAMQDEIGQNVVMWAQQYHQSSQQLLDAYKFLITTGLQPAEVNALMPALAEAATAHAIDTGDMQGAVFALADSFKISPEQMGGALAQMGYATKMGHFGADSFGAYLPQLGGALATAGDTGPEVADDTFAAMETIIKNVSIPSEAATDYTDMIHYVGSQHAMRTFMQMSRMMMPQMRELFDKYDIAPADILSMQNEAVAEGKDPIQTILDYVHQVTAKMTPTDRNAVISDYFTNQQGGDAVRSLMLHWDGYQGDISTLKGIGQDTLDSDFKAAVQNASGDMNLFAENLSELNRNFGAMLNYLVIQPANAIISPGYLAPPTGNPNLDGPPPGSQFTPRTGYQIPNLEIHLKVDQSGTVTGASSPTPGVNLKVNQGQVLGAP